MGSILKLIAVHVKHSGHAMELIAALVKWLTPDDVEALGKLVEPIIAARYPRAAKVVDQVERIAETVATEIQTVGKETETTGTETEPTVSNDAATVASSETVDSTEPVSEPDAAPVVGESPAAVVSETPTPDATKKWKTKTSKS